ncbi:MAG: diguanylate cyclase [Treponema sp.]|jgi:diguanylate cyclase (GGDEF)-like protein|nr:diguanylate cyclase [Treponema sp.]
MLTDTFFRQLPVLIPVSVLIFTVNCILLWKVVRLSQTKPETLFKSWKDFVPVSVFSLFQSFFSFLGVPVFAGGSVFFSGIKNISTNKLPGTLNASAAVPTAVLALVIITRYEMDPLTLVVAVITQVTGAVLTPQLVSKIQPKTIKRLLALGVVIAGIRLLLVPDFYISGDFEIGLRGYKLVIFGLLSVIYGALNNFGIGSFILTGVTAYILGLNIAATVPVMVCAAAISMPLAGIRFIKLGLVSSSVTLISSVAGATGVWVAAYFFETTVMDFRILGAVFVLCAIAMLTGFWWKKNRQPLDIVDPGIRISVVGIYMPLITGIMIGSEFIYASYTGLSRLYDAIIRQGADASVYVKEFIAYYGSSVFLILFFISLVVIALFGVLVTEISDHDKTKVKSLTDPLTGLANRRAFNDRLNEEWNRLMRVQAPVSLLMLDIDHFKNYNDTYGHPQGDELLKSLAGVARGSARRANDIAARLGGEEFGILLPGCSLENAINLAEDLRAKIEQMRVPLLDGGEPAVTTASIGVAAVVPAYGNSYDTLIKAADSLLYHAKQSGRNKVCS